jgi:hypothetical protein
VRRSFGASFEWVDKADNGVGEAMKQTEAVLVVVQQRCLRAGAPWTPALLEVLRGTIDPLVRRANNAEQDAMAARRELDALKKAEEVRCPECRGRGRVCDACAGSGER